MKLARRGATWTHRLGGHEAEGETAVLALRQPMKLSDGLGLRATFGLQFTLPGIGTVPQGPETSASLGPGAPRAADKPGSPRLTTSTGSSARVGSSR
jgi:hypothetical protein